MGCYVVLFPVLGFFEQGFYEYSWVADHWQYPVIAAPIALVVAFGTTLARQASALQRQLAMLAATAVLFLLAAATWTQERIYADDETLWQATVARNPGAWIAHYNLGHLSWEAGRLDDAIAHYKTALWLRPEYVEARDDLAVALMQLGRLSEAIEQSQQVLRTKPDAVAYVNLGGALLQMGRPREAIEQLEQAVRIDPNRAEVRYELGTILLKAGQLTDAIEQFDQALRLKPDDAQAHCDLGIALCRAGRARESISHFEQALRVMPDNTEAHYNLGLACELMGEPTTAIDEFQQALRINPDYAEVHDNLALALWRAGRKPEAIAQWQQAVCIKPDLARAHVRLGDALLETGNRQAAIEQYELGLQTQPDAVDAENSLAWLLATLRPAEGGNPARALVLAQRACELTNYKVAGCVNTLAAAYAATGRFDDAVATAQTAIDLAGCAGQMTLVHEAETRLELYRSRHAYQEPIVTR